MRHDCFPDSPADWPKGVFSELAMVNPRYVLDGRRTYPFLEMASVAENFGGVLGFQQRTADSSGLVRFRKNDILFGKITPCAENGKVALVSALPDEFGLGSTEFVVLSPKIGHVPRFVYALACSGPVHGRAVSRMEGSTGRLRITEDVFTKWLVVPLPPPDEQVAIARILDAADAAIERARLSVEKAERVRFGLLQHILSSGLTGHGSQTTKVGPVPKSWQVSNVGQEFDVSTGFTLGEHRKPKVNRRRYLRVANVQRGFIKLDDVSELEARDHEMEERTLAADDLLVVEGHADPKQIGRCAIVLPEAAGLTFQNHLFRLRPKRVLPKFGEIWLNGLQCQLYWQRTCATSSGLNTINQRKLKALPIAVPSPDEQRQVVELATAAETTCSAAKNRLAALERLKRGLMQDLLTGRVRVKGAESLIAATA